MPSTTGSVSRGRPMRRATISAREGSPRRAGSVADISTPMKVPCSASRRRAGRQVGAAERIAYQARPRTTIETHIKREAGGHQPGAGGDEAGEHAAHPDPRKRVHASTRPASDARASAPRRTVRSARRGAAQRELGLEARQTLGAHPGQQVGRRDAEPHRRAGGASGSRAHGERLLVDLEHLGRDVGPGEALRALARRRRHLLAPRGVERQPTQRLRERARVAARGEQAVDARRAPRRGSRRCPRPPRACPQRTPR